MDYHSVNVYIKEEILSPFFLHTHFLVIRTYSMFTLSYKKILQVYCLDSVSSGIPIHYSCTVCISSTGSFLLYYLVRNGIHDNTRTYIQFLFLTFVSILKCAQLKRSRPIIITAFVCLALNLQLGPPIVLLQVILYLYERAHRIINLEIPVLVGSLKSSSIELG